MAKSVRQQISGLIADVEKRARRLRKDFRKQYKSVPTSLDQAAQRLREGAADVAHQVETYVREIRLDLQSRIGGGTPKRSAAAKAARKKVKKAVRKAVKTARKSAKKAARKTAVKKSARR
jgi:hypothetical protein